MVHLIQLCNLSKYTKQVLFSVQFADVQLTQKCSLWTSTLEYLVTILVHYSHGVIMLLSNSIAGFSVNSVWMDSVLSRTAIRIMHSALLLFIAVRLNQTHHCLFLCPPNSITTIK